MLQSIGNVLVKMMGGTRNERLVRKMRQQVVEAVNPLEADVAALSDEQIGARSAELRRRLADGAAVETVKDEAYALIREASRRARAHRQFDVQLIAGEVLYNGGIAEEATGEGKTVACYPAIYLNALQGRKVHVVTVNDYLVRRDADFARPIFAMVGMTVGYIQAQMDNARRREAYACSITYGTNSEFGFDYLRDNMKLSVAEQVQGPLDYAIVDEVDNILIDEARTPLIISGPAYGDVSRYAKADKISRRLEQLQGQANRDTLERLRQWGDEPPRQYADHPKFNEALRRFRADPSQRSGFSLTEDEAEALGHAQYFVINAENKSAALTHNGVTAAQEDRELGAIYQDGAEWPHLITQSLRARVLYQKDRDYVVRDGEIIIVDEFTGRLMEGRQWSDGLHQAVEAKEGVRIKEENQTLATITLQNYFKLYDRLAGMTGTAMTESDEFMKIYSLEVIAVPTHRPVNRIDYNDRIYRSENEKFDAIVEEIRSYAMRGRPVLVGTTSVEKSEALSEALTRRHGIEHEVLNARPENAAREAEIVLKAGQQHERKVEGKVRRVGNVTIATNMAGRGTDIKLDPGTVHAACRVPADADLPAGVAPDGLYPAGVYKCCINCLQYDPDTNCAHCFKPKLDPDFPLRGRTDCRADVPCGLHVVGTERHEARRIDNQLRGRGGRQGDPGSSRFFLSLEDDLMRIFAGPTVLKMLDRLGMDDGMAIEHPWISKGLQRAQKRVEERNFDVRKHLLEYDEIMDYQRKTFYSTRQRILEGRDLHEIIAEMIAASIEAAVEEHLGGQYGRLAVVEWARTNLGLDLTPDRIRDTGDHAAEGVMADLRRYAKDEAAADISRSIGEYMDPDLDTRDWDLSGLCQWAQRRYGVNLSHTKLRKLPAGEVERELIEAVHQRIDGMDLAPVATYLSEDFPRTALAEWAYRRLSLRVEPAQVPAEAAAAASTLTDQAMAAYRRRSVEYPVEYAIQRAFPEGDTSNVHHVKALHDWILRKYRTDLPSEAVTGRSLDEVFALLMGVSRAYDQERCLDQEIDAHLREASSAADHAAFARERFETDLVEADFDGADAGEVLRAAGAKFLRREMTELERFVLLQEYDSAWKDHLLGMDHLKSGIGLRGFAEQDPKIAYKREGAQLFNQMQDAVRDRVAENIFKIRLSGTARLSSVYQIGQMVHEQLAGYDHLTQDMQAQQEATQPRKIETIVRATPKVGRNDPCPCGSGKKYKRCCGAGQG
ncbi:MAG: preprotein translocase subunit SecA [Planctomycetes bacterium]|nr:preprotein translocase subunit SecA [Planctomycetota bacterium]